MDILNLRDCYCYVMKDYANGYFKIGISDNPKVREKTLQSEKPVIRLLAKKRFLSKGAAREAERKYHKKYAENRIRGEWFELSNENFELLLQDFVTDCNTKPNYIMGEINKNVLIAKGDIAKSVKKNSKSIKSLLYKIKKFFVKKIYYSKSSFTKKFYPSELRINKSDFTQLLSKITIEGKQVNYYDLSNWKRRNDYRLEKLSKQLEDKNIVIEFSESGYVTAKKVA